MRGLLRALEPHASRRVVLRSRSNDWCDPRRLADVDLVSRWGLVRLRLLRAPLLLCGGTHFHDGDSGQGRSRHLVAMALLGGQLLANRLAGGGFHLVAVGLGPYRGRAVRSAVRAILRFAGTVSVRDDASRIVVESLLGRDVPVIEDLAWYCRELEALAHAPLGAGGMLIIPVPDPHNADATMPSAEDVRALSKVMNRVSVMTFNGTDRNRRGTARTAAAAEVPDRSPEPGSDVLERALSEIVDHEVVLSARFHGVLAARALDRPVIAWPYHPKVTELARKFAVPIWEVDREFDQILHEAVVAIGRRHSAPLPPICLGQQLRVALS